MHSETYSFCSIRYLVNSACEEATLRTSNIFDARLFLTEKELRYAHIHCHSFDLDSIRRYRFKVHFVDRCSGGSQKGINHSN